MTIAAALSAKNAEIRRRYFALLLDLNTGDLEAMANLDRLRIALGKTPDEVDGDYNALRIMRNLASEDAPDPDDDLWKRAARATAAANEHVEKKKRFLAAWAEENTKLAMEHFALEGQVKQRASQGKENSRALADMKRSNPEIAEFLFGQSQRTPNPAA